MTEQQIDAILATIIDDKKLFRNKANDNTLYSLRNGRNVSRALKLEVLVDIGYLTLKDGIDIPN